MPSDLLQLSVDAETRALLATCAARDEPVAPALDTLRLAVQEAGWPDNVLDESAVAAFLNACRLSQEAVCMPVGAVQDGSFEIALAPDRMAAMLSLTPPRGGKAVTQEEIRTALQALGVVSGLLEDALRLAVESGACEALAIARGRAPEPGSPTRFESLIDDAHLPAQRNEDDGARVDYRNLGNLLLVATDQPLMRRIPARQGVAGEDVLGQAIAAAPVRDIPFRKDLAGVRTDPADPELLLAAIPGVPVVLADGVKVSSLLEVSAVSLESGNIVFDGSLEVKGDITLGMEVRVTGDVAVHGTIEAALVHADGNISVNGGIIGIAERPHDEADPVRMARITCGGSVKARFISHTEVQAGKDVVVEREIRQSRVTAGDSVRVGPSGPQGGVITGGATVALKSVQCGTLGSLSGMPTAVRVGLDPYAEARHAALKHDMAELSEKHDKVEKLALFLATHPDKDVDGVGQRTRNTLEQMRVELTGLKERETQALHDMQPLQTATITATRRFYGGVTLLVGGKMLELLEEHPGAQAVLSEDAIAMRSPNPHGGGAG